MKNIEKFFNEKLMQLRDKMKTDLGTELKVAFYDLKTGQAYDISGNEIGWAASMIKVPVLVATFREIDRGMSLNEKLDIDHRFTLDPTSEVSARPQGSTITIDELLNYMILASCNESTNMLGDRIGIERINATMDELGCPKTKISHLLHVGASLVYEGIDGTSSNTTTAIEMTKLMAKIYNNQTASETSSEQMRAILENRPEIEYRRPNVNGFLKTFLPRGTIVGCKAGLLEEDVMETGVINSDYALTIMINKIPSGLITKSIPLIGRISMRIFEEYYKK
ncbi:MAG: serine hydrolase [Nanoarchaeota archaeon]